MIKQRENYFKLRDSRFRLDSKKKFFVVRVVGHWNRLNRDVVDTSFLEVLKATLVGELRNMF